MKKLNKLVAILVALAMMMALAVTSAFAADITAGDDQGSAVTNGTYNDPANIVIEKVLKLPAEATDPAKTFNFTVAQVTDDADRVSAAAVTTAVFNDTLSATPARAEEGATTETGITGKVFKEKVDWPEAGTYYFKVTEDRPTASDTVTVSDTATDGYYTVTEKNGTKTETYKYNADTYYIVVGVAKTTINGEEHTYINSIAVTNKDGKVEIKEITVTEKDDDDQDVQVTYKGFDIDNEYSVVEADLLEIGKTVKGVVVADDAEATAANEKFDPTKTFNFHVTVKAPATSSNTKYTAYLYKNGVKADPEVKYEFTSGVTQDIALAHGQSIKFADLDVGATYSVTEDDYSAIGYAMEAGTDQATAIAIKADGSSKTTIQNNYDSTKDNTQTGLTLNNLPFIVLALVAIGGLVAYVVVRRRNADEA